MTYEQVEAITDQEHFDSLKWSDERREAFIASIEDASVLFGWKVEKGWFAPAEWDLSDRRSVTLRGDGGPRIEPRRVA